MVSKLSIIFLVVTTVVFNFNFVAHGVDERDIFSAEKKSALDKFRPLIGEYQTQDYMKSDLYLLRWLKAGNFDIAASVDLMKKSNKWRKDNKIDDLIHEDLQAHYKHLLYSIDKVDRTGHPILYIPFAKWDLRKYALAGKGNFVVRYWWQILEKLELRVYEIAKSTGKPISKIYFLANADGFSLSQHGCLQCLALYPAIVSSVDPHHPYFVTAVNYINVPRIALPFLTIVKEALRGQPTLQLVRIYSHDKTEWQNVILQDIAQDQLPPSFGVTEE